MTELMRDHPVVETMMHTGYPQGEPKLYQCPACGEDITGITRLFQGVDGEILGCERCVREIEAGEEWEDTHG